MDSTFKHLQSAALLLAIRCFGSSCLSFDSLEAMTLICRQELGLRPHCHSWRDSYHYSTLNHHYSHRLAGFTCWEAGPTAAVELAVCFGC